MEDVFQTPQPTSRLHKQDMIICKITQEDFTTKSFLFFRSSKIT